jgi:DNA end-binding protein Ku
MFAIRPKIVLAPGVELVMASRAFWIGQLRLSLLSIPIKLYPAIRSERRTRLHQIHEPSGERIRYKKFAPGVGLVKDEEVSKGFEYEKGKYVRLHREEIDQLKLESKKTIELVRFVDDCEIDPRYFEKPYYLLPDGELAEEGYAVIQSALAEMKKIGVGQFGLRGHSYIVAIKPCGRGLFLEVLRHAGEIRSADSFFKELPKIKVDKEVFDLAVQLIKRKSGKFEPERFKDEYWEAMQDLIRAKLKQRPRAIASGEPSSARVVNIMDVLKKSVQQNNIARVRKASRPNKSGVIRAGDAKKTVSAIKPKSA